MRYRMGDLRWVLREAAMTPKQSSGKGLALYVYEDSSTVKQVVVYNPSFILSRLEPTLVKLARSGETIESGDLFNPWTLMIRPQAAVIGMLTLAPPMRGDCHGAWVVKSAAAHSGYGPMVYDLALSVAPNNTLIPDRFSVSDDAEGIWRFYAKRRGDVQKLPLDDIKDPKTPPPEDDCDVHAEKGKDWLDTAYRAHSKIDPARLGTNHNNFVGIIKRVIRDNGINVKGGIEKGIELMVGDLADESFLRTMRGE